MTLDTEKIVQLSQRQDKMCKYDLLKTLMISKEKSKTENKALYRGGLLSIICLVVIAGLYWRTQLGLRPTSLEIALTQVQCPIVGNAESKLYHLPDDSHYLELLQSNKAKDNRICFYKEWETFIAGYRRSKF